MRSDGSYPARTHGGDDQKENGIYLMNAVICGNRMGKSKWNMVLSAAKRSDADRLGMDQRTVVLFFAERSDADRLGFG